MPIIHNQVREEYYKLLVEAAVEMHVLIEKKEMPWTDEWRTEIEEAGRRVGLTLSSAEPK